MRALSLSLISIGFLAACGSSGPPVRTVPSPYQLLALDQVVDSAAVYQALLAQFGEVGGRFVASVGVDSTGALAESWIIETNLADDVADRLHELIRDNVRTGGELRPLRVRTDITTGPNARIQLVQSYDTHPRILNWPDINALATQLRVPGRSVQVAIYADTQGMPAEVRIRRSSGDPTADAHALHIGWQVRFSPALHDGRPVAVWTNLPITWR